MTDCSDPQCGVCRRVIEDAEREGVWVCSTCFDVPETIDGYVRRLNHALRGPITTRRRVSEEVHLHLEELAAQEGETRSRADAERRATQRMGSPEKLAAEMPHRRWNPWIVIVATILCGAAGFAYSTHQPKQFASTSSVLYNPAGSGSSSSKGQAGDWGSNYEPFAQSAEVADEVLAGLHPRIPGLTPAQLARKTSITVIPTGNGLSFTVTDLSALNAVRLAGAYAEQFPIYLAKNTPDPDLARMEQGLAAVRLKLARADSTTLAATIAKWMARKAAFQAAITVHNRLKITDAAQTTSTVSRTATAPTQTQPKPIRTMATGALIGFAIGTVLAFILYLFDTRPTAAPRAVAG